MEHLLLLVEHFSLNFFPSQLAQNFINNVPSKKIFRKKSISAKEIRLVLKNLLKSYAPLNSYNIVMCEICTFQTCPQFNLVEKDYLGDMTINKPSMALEVLP